MGVSCASRLLIRTDQADIKAVSVPNPQAGRLRVAVAGRFPPPIDGQALASERLLTLLASACDVSRVDLRYDVHASPLKTARRAVGTTFAARRSLRETPLDAVVWSTPSPRPFPHYRDTVLSRFARNQDTSLIGWIHWGDFARLHKQVSTRSTASLLYRQLSALVVLSEWHAQELGDHPDLPPVHVIPNTIDADRIPPCRDLAESIDKRASLLEDGKLRLCFVSNMSREKGYLSFVRAIAHLRRWGVNATGEMAGRWLTQADRIRFYRELDALGLTKHVQHRGALSDARSIMDIFMGAHFFLFPSVYSAEAQPLVAIEALASGTPLVALNRGLFNGLVCEGKFGAIAGDSSPTSLASAVSRAQSQHWPHESLAARATFNASFSPDAVRRVWLDRLHCVSSP